MTTNKTLRNLLTATAAVALLSTGVLAQTAPSTQTTPMAPTTQAPATRGGASTTMSGNETTSSRIVGAAIYAPKQAGSRTDAASPMTTGSVSGFPTMSDADWKTMTSNHDRIGEIDNLVIGNDGRVHQVVMGVGGFLGIGEKSVAVNFTDVRWQMDSNGKVFGVIQRTKEQLNQAPAFVDRS
ncbi:PRC-barrel domain-containing protein [Phreatobacter aquaticus]|nr:PRC-barrel domain-containing protein [Phreatobacter aquaticus]